ncbi:hypothetical protein DXX99_09060 [Ammonifex thiophilus]|uniref:DNA topoisomerase type IA zn finger domain-containing protein n=1 Tax=Ammonifex thiophilus TaxID=444093 RepID=A0A3D8P3W2_9THEO|nr:hypothetical protein DXX99_09060 [Ammonifex thiophilus]
MSYFGKELQSVDLLWRLRGGRDGLLFSCSECRKTVSLRRLAEELIAELGLQCPRCGEGKLCYRTSSPFLGCDRFPACRYTLDLQ